MQNCRAHLLFFCCLVFSVFDLPATACQCGVGEATPCASLSNYGAILVGTVQSVDNRPLTEFPRFSKTHSGWSWREQYRMFKDEVVINFSVQEVFKGTHSSQIAVRVTKFLGSCGFEYKPGELYFQKGKQYLVYAGSWDGHLGTTHCSPTRLATAAVREIEEFRRLRDLPGPRIIGSYNIHNDYEVQSPAVGQTITFSSGAKQIATTVQSDGRFSLTSVSPGTYDVTAAVPHNYRIEWYEFGHAYRIRDQVSVNPRAIDVKTDSCTEIELQAFPDGRISGIVVDPRGKPLKGIAVRVWKANRSVDLDHWWGWKETNDHGEFEQSQLPPGSYLVGVYIWPPDQLSSFLAGGSGKPRLWFYPGVLDPKHARLITLKFAQHRSSIRVSVPAKNPE
jgi:hypothetical protein